MKQFILLTVFATFFAFKAQSQKTVPLTLNFNGQSIELFSVTFPNNWEILSENGAIIARSLVDRRASITLLVAGETQTQAKDQLLSVLEEISPNVKLQAFLSNKTNGMSYILTDGDGTTRKGGLFPYSAHITGGVFNVNGIYCQLISSVPLTKSNYYQRDLRDIMDSIQSL